MPELRHEDGQKWKVEAGVSVDKLKPCPFCGCEAIITEIPPHKHAFATFMPDYEGSATVECCLCGAALIKTTKDEAIKAWNRRDGA